MDITKFKEEPNKAEGALPGEKLLIEETASINVPEVKPHEYAVMYMQRNLPGGMPGCTTTTNGDPSLGEKVIRGTASFYKACERISASLDILPQDFGYNPDHMENKLAIYVSVMGIDLDDHEAFMDDNKQPGGRDQVKPKHPAMNIKLAEGQMRPEIPENAFIYLQDWRIIELKFVPFADWKTWFMLYLCLALETGESFVICCRACFDENLPKSFKDYATRKNPVHYDHRMPSVLAKLLDGTRATVVMQGAKTVEMIYNTTGWLPLDGEAMTGRYRFEPKDHTCFSWFTNDELVFTTFVDQLITKQLLN